MSSKQVDRSQGSWAGLIAARALEQNERAAAEVGEAAGRVGRLRALVTERGPSCMDCIADEWQAAAHHANKRIGRDCIRWYRHESGGASLVVNMAGQIDYVAAYPDFSYPDDLRPTVRVVTQRHGCDGVTHVPFVLDEVGELALLMPTGACSAADAARLIAEPWFSGLDLPRLLAKD